MTVQSVLDRLDRVKRSKSGWTALCPAHRDKTPSLSVNEGKDGRVLLKCHTGCPPEEITAAIGLKMSDLFNNGKPRRNGTGHERVIVATYDYQDEQGDTLFQVVRYKPKDFRQRHRQGDKWIWNMEGIKRVLFRLPQVIEAIKDGRAIHVCEGEADVLAMEKAGFAATCNPGGAGKWQEDFGQYFKAGEVVIIADKDEPGRKHAEDIARKLHGTAASVKVIECPDVNGTECKDPKDYFEAGGGAADLDELARGSPEWSEQTSEEGSKLPPIIDAAEFLAREIESPRELVYGVLHQGSKMCLGGSSKSFKTWTLLDLAVSVATGEPWLNFKVAKGRTLFINLEIQPAFIQQRIRAVEKEKHIKINKGQLDVWNLRGHATSYQILLAEIASHIKNLSYVLIILDPLYKLLGGADENSASDVAGLLNAIEALAVQSKAAVVFGSHYSKGNQAQKESIDRISGSGVFARDPDSILNFTAHEEPGAFVVEGTLRNFKPIDPFVVRWAYPLMRRDEGLDPAKLKRVGGRPSQYSTAALLELLKSKKLSTQKWQKLASAETGMSRTRFYELMSVLKKSPELKKTKSGLWFCERNKK